MVSPRMSGFDAREYWERRLADTYTLDGVGYAGLGRAFNGWMYKVRRAVFLRAVRDAWQPPPDAPVLDIGSGTGFYVDRWHELGIRQVTGSDITDTAVGRLRERYPQDRFERFDAGGAELPFAPGSFEAISAIDILFHIVGDEPFRRAFANVAELLAPGGLFFFTDNFIHRGAERVTHQVSRPLGEIEGIVAAAGLEIVTRRPMFFLLNAPVDSQSRALHTSWRLVSGVAARHEALGAAVGAAVYPLERALVARASEGPSTELMVCRRPS
jgi:SAM-dependent methyltransferase